MTSQLEGTAGANPNGGNGATAAMLATAARTAARSSACVT